MSACEHPRPPPRIERKSLRRRLAAWAGIEDHPPAGHESWWFLVDTASNLSKGIVSCSIQVEATTDTQRNYSNVRSRKRDWFKVLLAARNLATVIYAVSNTITLPVLPFMVNRLIYPQPPAGPSDPGSAGVPEVWRGMAYGLVMSGYYLTKTISAPWIGFLSDKMGRRQALVATLIGGAFAFFITKIWGQHSIHGLIMCRLLMGCFAANGALMHAYIRDTVPPEWQSSAFSQHSASWGCAYLAAPALIAWAGDNADAVLGVATITMVVSAIIVEITFVDTRPEEFRTQRMSRIVGEYLKEGARDLAEVGKKMSGVDLAEYFNGGREKEHLPPAPSATTTFGSNGGSRGYSSGTRSGDASAGDKAVAGVAHDDGGLHNRKGSRVEPSPSGGVSNGNIDISSNGNSNHTSLTGEMGERNGNGAARAGAGKEKRPRLRNVVSGRALVGTFKGMMRERFVQVTFILQAIRPAQDLAPLVALKFSGGASVLAGITSSRSLCRVLVPMTPLIPWLVRLAGGSSGEGAVARMGGDRAVAACMCLLMAGTVLAVPTVGTLRELHHVMAFNGLCYIVRESTAGAVMARAAGTSSVGAFFGWQHCMKGIQGSLSYFLTGWLSGYSIALPYYVVAVCDLLYAFTYLYI